jgi:hypothetical protein
MTEGGIGFNEVWINLPEWIRDLDVESLRKNAGIPQATPPKKSRPD